MDERKGMERSHKDKYKTPEARAGHKYNISRKHREAESRGMKRSHRGESRDMSHYNDEMHGYADDEMTRMKGKEYYGMGYGQVANLPQEHVQHTYPEPYPRLKEDYPDTIREIDEDMMDSFRKTEMYPSDSMY